MRRSDRGGMSHWYFRRGEFLAVDAINDARAYMTAKKLLEQRRSIRPEEIADPAFDPRSRFG